MSDEISKSSPAAGVETAKRADMSYSDYLKLDDILNAQAPRSDAHDEMLFIVQHQASELWMRLAIYEMDAARAAIARSELQPAMKMLRRVTGIFAQLNSAWDILRTMTPSEYTMFRDHLGEASGFQSWQYRRIEFIVGNRNAAQVGVHQKRADVIAALEAELARPSLYDETVRFLLRSGFEIDPKTVNRDLAKKYQACDSVREAWRIVYEDPDTHWPCYELAEKLVDFEDYFRRWRFNHVTTVERVIGFKSGTGGTDGVNYLKKMLDTVLFPELWSVRTSL